MKLSMPLITSENQFRSSTLLADLEQRLFELVKMGYNGVDLAVRDRRFIDPKALTVLLQKYHLEVASLNTDALWVEEKMSLTDAEGTIRKVTLTRMTGYIPLALHLKTVMCLGISRGDGKGLAVEEANEYLVDALKALCSAAEEYKVKIALEPLNRNETTVVNTVKQGLDIILRVGKDNLGLVLNTYHMNMEESLIEDSIRLCKGKIFHVKIADANRRAPGSGYMNFASIVKTLKAVGYKGYLAGDFLPVPTAEAAAQKNIAYLRDLVKD
jgi:sugar phosphate isomerase/epimerase